MYMYLLLLFERNPQSLGVPFSQTSPIPSRRCKQLWDFELSTVKPVVTHKAGGSLSCLLFSTNSPVVVCGGETGTISVFRTHNIEREYDTLEEQQGRLDEVIRANVMRRQPGTS